MTYIVFGDEKNQYMYPVSRLPKFIEHKIKCLVNTKITTINYHFYIRGGYL